MAAKPINPKNTSNGHTFGQDASDPISFYGATAVAKQSVTGARDDGTALASLLDALEALGLITDGSTAS